jgi:hypothetical protein
VTAKVIAVAVSTALIILAVAALLLFMLLIGMNGVQERKATPIFIGYFVMTAVVTVISGALSGWGSRRLSSRLKWPMLVTGPLSVLVMSVAGALALVAVSFLLLMTIA